MIPNDILYSKISALSSHQKDFFQQQMRTDTETHSQTLFGKRVSIFGGLYQMSPLRPQQILF